MSDITKQDLERIQAGILEAMNAGFQGVQDQMDEVKTQIGTVDQRVDRVDHHLGNVKNKIDLQSYGLDRMAKKVDTLYVETGAQSSVNLRTNGRLDRLEENAGLEPVAA